MNKLDVLKLVCQHINIKYIDDNYFKINALNLFKEKIIEIKKEFDLIINVYNKKIINNNLMLKYKFLFKQFEYDNSNYIIFNGIYDIILLVIKITKLEKIEENNILNKEIAKLLLINENDLLINNKFNNLFIDELNNFYNIIGYKKIKNKYFLQIKQFDILELYIKYIENEYFNIIWTYRTYISLNNINTIEEYFKNIPNKENLIKEYNETFNKYNNILQLLNNTDYYYKFIGIFGCLRFILEILDICNIKSNVIVDYSNNSTDIDENVDENGYIVLPSNIKKERTIKELKQQQKLMLDYEIDRLFYLDLCLDT